jgi:hypothetical protein
MNYDDYSQIFNRLGKERERLLAAKMLLIDVLYGMERVQTGIQPQEHLQELKDKITALLDGQQVEIKAENEAILEGLKVSTWKDSKEATGQTFTSLLDQGGAK